MKEEDYQSLNFRNRDVDNIRSRSNTNTNPKRDTLVISSRTAPSDYRSYAAMAFPGIDTTKDTVVQKYTKQGNHNTRNPRNLSPDTKNTRVVKDIKPFSGWKNLYTKLKRVSKNDPRPMRQIKGY
jgi:hypothetical protein